MFPTLFDFELFGRHFAVNGYGLMIGLGLVVWVRLVSHEAERRGHEIVRRTMFRTLAIFVASLYLGGKGLYWITIIGAPSEMEEGTGTGFVFFGALLLALPVMTWRARSLGMSTLEGLDIFALPCTLAHALGRIGCFCAGCCFGHRTDVSWSVTFDDGTGLNHVALHPVQLYEAVGLVALWAVLWFWLRKRAAFDGLVLLAYFIGYSALRCITEIYRGDPGRRFLFSEEVSEAGDPPAGMATSVFISILLTIGSVSFLLWLLARRRRARAS